MIDWRLEAACRDMPFDLFFPLRGEPTEPAKRICRACPSQVECLAEALTVPPSEDHGVRGGTSERQRREMRRRSRGARRLAS